MTGAKEAGHKVKSVPHRAASAGELNLSEITRQGGERERERETGKSSKRAREREREHGGDWMVRIFEKPRTVDKVGKRVGGEREEEGGEFDIKTREFKAWLIAPYIR